MLQVHTRPMNLTLQEVYIGPTVLSTVSCKAKKRKKNETSFCSSLLAIHYPPNPFPTENKPTHPNARLMKS